MYNLVSAGRSMFAAGIIALGILCFIAGDFIVGRPPAWPASLALSPVLGYITGAVIILCAVAILVKKYAVPAAGVIAALIILLSVFRHLPTIADTWPNAFKAIALAGGCLIVAFAAKSDSSTASFSFMHTKKWLLTGIIALAVFLLVCGFAHFKYAPFVDTLIPDYIPFHSFWTYFCGICLLAGGIGLFIPATRRLAALLSGIMITGWFFLLHIPRFIADTSNASDRMGVCESFAIAGICFCVAGLLAKNKFAVVPDTKVYSNEILPEQV